MGDDYAFVIDALGHRLIEQDELGDGGALVLDFLRARLGEDYCLVMIDRADCRYTIVLEQGWIDIARDVQALEPASDDSDALPRAAMKAVIAGWPQDWNGVDNGRLSVVRSSDGIPHVAVQSALSPQA